jgi:hypothetical protein
MPAHKRRQAVLKESPALMISMSSMRNQNKYAIHDQNGKHLCDVSAASKRYAIAKAKTEGHVSASQAFELNT